MLRPILLAVGIVALAMGILWMAQGSGVFPYPAASFMIDQRPWILRGAILAVVGVAAIIFARRV